MLAELPAVVVQDGGDLAASELSIDQHNNGLSLVQKRNQLDKVNSAKL